ncbi:peroxidase family protein [Fodinicurvata sediminis]|uniref:peroxidase family protein n=1 Tax=Fodinicurvata sediminis TaxID=1121832 RepID=UPI0003F4F86F|nr:peroxidase family protein [Fodinicurvata sediminis]
MSHGSSSKGGVLAPRSRLYQGPFGRIFAQLPPWSPPGLDESNIADHLLELAQTQMVEAPGKKPAEVISDTDLSNQLDTEFDSEIPAGYTYFGQFVDHDITFDPASSLMRRNDPEGLLNHRTPRLDLDNIYGHGRANSPYLFDQQDPDKMLIGSIEGSNLPDLPRTHPLNSQGRAMVGDMRNDENAIVCQLQLAFLLAHNTLVDRARSAGLPDPFEAAARTLRWLYQYVVWHDFIKRITQPRIWQDALRHEDCPDGRSEWNIGLGSVYNWKHQPFMPVEFSVAAYRFGHSMVRNAYQTNQPHRGFGNFAPLFDNTGAADPDDLRGFRPMKPGNSIQWDWFLDMESSTGPFPQLARKIDTKLANALTALHEAEAGSNLNILAFRNLLRGWRFELPSGSSVATALGFTPLDIPPERDALWFYILAEAEDGGGNRLGQVGSVILCATFAGLLKGDPQCWMNIDPRWTPDKDPLLQANDKRDSDDWEVAAIIRLSGLPVAGGDFN